MYMIAGLCMLKLYQKRHPDINASAYTAYACLAAVIFFSVLGVVSSAQHRRRRSWRCSCHIMTMVSFVFVGVWKRKHGLLDRFLSHPYSGHSPPQHTALLHGKMEIWWGHGWRFCQSESNILMSCQYCFKYVGCSMNIYKYKLIAAWAYLLLWVCKFLCWGIFIWNLKIEEEILIILRI